MFSRFAIFSNRKVANMPKIVSQTVVGPNAGQNYGNLITSGIKYEDGSPVTIQGKLYVKFLCPPSTAPPELDTISPWQDVKVTFTSVPLDDKSLAITAELKFPGQYTFNGSETLTWGINGDLIDDPSKYTDSFELYADKLPTGTVEVVVPAAPDAALSSSEQTITLIGRGVQRSLSAPPGKTTTFDDVDTGSYTVKVDDLTDDNETVVATATVSPTEITVEEGAKTTLKVSYGAPQKFSALDITVGQLSSPLDEEKLHVEVKVDGNVVKVFDSPNNYTTSLRRLPPSGTATVSAGLTLNNVKYTSDQSVKLSNALIDVDIDNGNISSTNIDTSSFVNLPINVTTDLGSSDESIALRLISQEQTAFIYTKTVPVKSGSLTLPPVAPGRYKVSAPGYIKDGTLYGAHVVSEITVASGGGSKIDMEILQGPKLAVKGFPDYLSFGAISDLVDGKGEDLTAAKVTSVFKYAGVDGGGDPKVYLDDDQATKRTVALAKTVSDNLEGQSVLPVMISYTINLSGGNNDVLKDEDGLAHSFGNLILSMQLATAASKNEVPVGYIVNPDFLGENQKYPRRPTFGMPVREPLKNALAKRNVAAEVPSTITEDLAGYAQAVNWVIRKVAPEAVFGWQVNLWGTGSSQWVYAKDDTTAPITNAKSTAAYIKEIGVYAGEWAPDFLAIDRYEADDFTLRGYSNSYCYGPREWERFYDFVRSVALELKVPVMPWQIPASRIPRAVGDVVTTDSLEDDHWGTGGTYIFGDEGIGSDLNNIHQVVRDIDLTPYTIIKQPNVESLFKSSEPFDLGVPTWGDFPLRGIFSVLLGGGMTTGVVTSIGTTGKWTQEKIAEYMEDPIPLSSASK